MPLAGGVVEILARCLIGAVVLPALRPGMVAPLPPGLVRPVASLGLAAAQRGVAEAVLSPEERAAAEGVREALRVGAVRLAILVVVLPVPADLEAGGAGGLAEIELAVPLALRRFRGVAFLGAQGDAVVRVVTAIAPVLAGLLRRGRAAPLAFISRVRGIGNPLAARLAVLAVGARPLVRAGGIGIAHVGARVAVRIAASGGDALGEHLLDRAETVAVRSLAVLCELADSELGARARLPRLGQRGPVGPIALAVAGEARAVAVRLLVKLELAAPCRHGDGAIAVALRDPLAAGELAALHVVQEHEIGLALAEDLVVPELAPARAVAPLAGHEPGRAGNLLAQHPVRVGVIVLAVACSRRRGLHLVPAFGAQLVLKA